MNFSQREFVAFVKKWLWRTLFLFMPGLLLLRGLLSLFQPAQEGLPQSNGFLRQREAVQPAFYACDRPLACGPAGFKSHYLLDLLKNVVPPVEALVKRGRKPVLLQIGAASFTAPTLFTDVDLFTKTLALFPPATRVLLRLVLVEPNLFYHDSIVAQVGTLGLAEGQVQIVHAMVNDWCPEDNILMHRFSRQAERDFGVPFAVYGSWLGTDPTLPTRALSGYSAATALETPIMDRWLAFSKAANRTSYVEKVTLPCLTPAGLLASMGALMSDIVMLVIDAENSDFRIVSRFSDFPRFMPGFLQFECTGDVWNTARAVIGDLSAKLAGHGLAVGTTNGHGRDMSDEDNCVAVPLK